MLPYTTSNICSLSSQAPIIKGHLNNFIVQNNYNVGGAFKAETHWNRFLSNGTIDTLGAQVILDANLSNSVYKDVDTINPESYKTCFYIKF